MRKYAIVFLLLVNAGLCSRASAQSAPLVHELYLSLGLYAPDRFQNSISASVRYEYHFDPKFSLGAAVGFAKAGQDFFQKVGLAAPEQGSSTVIYYDGRVTQAFPVGQVIPYAVAGLGITRQHSESNLTITLGIGTKIPIGERSFLRYEINDHIFSSGQGNTSWTNNNLEFSAGFSFYLE